jgi:hypothetical protein
LRWERWLFRDFWAKDGAFAKGEKCSKIAASESKGALGGAWWELTSVGVAAAKDRHCVRERQGRHTQPALHPRPRSDFLARLQDFFDLIALVTY